MREHSQNGRYLPGVLLPAELALSDVPMQQLCALVVNADLIVIATPMAALRQMLHLLRHCPTPVVWLCKGFEVPFVDRFGRLAHEIQAQVAPDLIAGVFSGPSFAQELARGLPTALVAASPHEVLRQTLVDAFHLSLIHI